MKRRVRCKQWYGPNQQVNELCRLKLNTNDEQLKLKGTQAEYIYKEHMTTVYQRKSK